MPNAQLIKENVSYCRDYNDRSIAEQNSVDIAWNLLMTNSYTNLRSLLFPTEKELIRFRALVVNSIMATGK